MNRSDYNFDYFLHTALNNIRKESEKGGGRSLEFPTLEQFLCLANAIKSALTETDDEREPHSHHDLRFTPEFDTLERLTKTKF